MKKAYIISFLFLFSGFGGFSQKIVYPAHFSHLLKKANIDFFEPLEAGYRDYEPEENQYHNCHFAIRSRKEGLDIRYYIVPWSDGNPFTVNPHINTFTTLTNVAINADDAVISAIQPNKEKLLDDFNADWGMIYLFKPKEDFSDKKNCRMVALCKEGQGTVFVFYLFDDVKNEALDTRFLSLRFLENKG